MRKILSTLLIILLTFNNLLYAQTLGNSSEELSKPPAKESSKQAQGQSQVQEKKWYWFLNSKTGQDGGVNSGSSINGGENSTSKENSAPPVNNSATQEQVNPDTQAAPIEASALEDLQSQLSNSAPNVKQFTEAQLPENNIQWSRNEDSFSADLGVGASIQAQQSVTLAAAASGLVISKKVEFKPPLVEKIADSPAGYYRLKTQDAQNFELSAGAPLLLNKSVKFLVPFGKKVVRVRVTPGRAIEIPGEYLIEPTPLPVPTSRIGPVKPTVPNPNIYNSSKDYPEIPCYAYYPWKKSGYAIFVVNLAPVKYLPAKRKLFYYPEMLVEVKLASSSSNSSALALNASGATELSAAGDVEIIKQIKEMVDNPDIISSYKAAIAFAPAKSAPAAQSIKSGAQRTVLPPLGGPYKYVIITNDVLKSNFEPLVNQKISRGITATIVTTEEIYANFSGVETVVSCRDNADKIRNFIKSAYNNWQTRYVLLGGDVEVVPTRGVSVSTVGYTDNNLATDMYFSCLDGVWNSNGNAFWGETNDNEEGNDIDLLPDIAVGRASASNPSEVTNFVNKTIAYENNYHVNAKKAIFLGELLSEPGEPVVQGSDSMKAIRDACFSSTWQNQGTEHYDEFGVWSGAQFLQDLNNNPHIINHLGHAYQTYNGRIYNSDVETLLNNNSYYFMYSQGCDSGSFDTYDRCIAESHTLSAHGAVGVVMNSRYGWYSTMSGYPAYSHYYALSFWNGVFLDDLRSFGDVNNYSKSGNIQLVLNSTYRWIHFETNLFGDPETPFNFGPLDLPVAPDNLSASNVSQDELDLNWRDNSNNEDGFIIETSNDGVSFEVLDTVSAGVTTYHDWGLKPNTTYYYRVCANNADGKSGYSNVISVKTVSSLPEAPSNLAANAIDSTGISLSWQDNSNNEDGFKIERRTDGGTFTQIATVAAGVTSCSNLGLAASTTYYYRVRAYNAQGNSGYSDVASATTQTVIPSPPSSLTATAVSISRIDLSWRNNSGNEDGFKIEKGTDGNTFSEIATVVSGSVFYSDINLSINTTYYYRVRAYNTKGDSDYSNVATAIIQIEIPNPPTNLTATVVSTGQINLSWEDNSGDEDGFKVERGADGNTFSQIASMPAGTTSYNSTGLAANTKYYYRVSAYNAAGSSVYTNTANAVTQDSPQPPAAPNNLTAAVVSTTQINLSWTDNSDNEQGFKIERGEDGIIFIEIATADAGTTSYSNAGLNSATTYYYRIRAYNAQGDSAYSNVVSAITQNNPEPPVAPRNLIAAVVSTNQIDLSWLDNSSNEDGFKIERSLDGNSFNQITTVTAGTVNYSNTELAVGTMYYYRVRAYNAQGDSGYSNVANAKTYEVPLPPAAPGNLIVTVISSSQIDLSWQDNSDKEIGFKVERGVDGVNFAVIATLSADVTNYKNTNLNAATTYYYRLSAYNNVGESGYSNTASGTTIDEIPKPPTILSAVVVSDSRINLSWQDNSGNEAGFKLERRSTGTDYLEIATLSVGTTFFSDSGLSADTAYYYRVRAYNNLGFSIYTNIANATTQNGMLQAPSNLAATSVSAGQINLSWEDNSSDEKGFKIERSTDGVRFVIYAVTKPNITTFSNTKLTSGLTYYYRVRAFSATNSSGYSNTASALAL